MRHAVLAHSSFFEHMEEFGYLRGIEEMLPEDFTAVFEIARVLEDPESGLYRALEQVMSVSSGIVEPKEERTREWTPNRNVTQGEEYEAALMRSTTDLTRIFPHQFLLPDDIFMQRLAQRSLWINVPRTPVIIPFKSSASDFAPNNFKQKVYLLLDTSTSMSSHHRFQMAKAAVYVFLKRNLRELGHIYLRTFDTDLGPLQTATDTESLWTLIRYTMRLHRLGNGTVMERAILQAADDIRAQAALSGAEILMVTDGACHLDVEKIRASLGSMIRINTIKIGNVNIVPDEKLLHDLALRGPSAESRQLAGIEEEIRRAKNQVSKSAADNVIALTRRAQQLRAPIIERLSRTYGREIEQLSTVFVNVDDITADAIFTLRESEIDEIRELMAEVEMDFEQGIDADAMREAALLYEHVQMLLKTGGPPEQIRQLEEMARKLEELLKDVMETSTAIDSALTKLSRSDVHDIQMMLGMRSAQVGQSLLQMLLGALRRSLESCLGNGQ